MVDDEEEAATPVRSPAREINIKQVFLSKAEFFASVCDVAYLRRLTRGAGAGAALQFDVMKDPSITSSSSIAYICCASCEWRMEAKISRTQGMVGQCTVSLVNDRHNNDCMGSIPQPSRIWLQTNPSIRNVALHCKTNEALITHAKSMGLHMNRQDSTAIRTSVKKSVGTASGASYMLIEPWLREFCRLNPGAEYEFKRNDETNEFEHAFLMLPCLKQIQHSFMGTLAADCGFSIDSASYKQVSFCSCDSLAILVTYYH